MLTVECIAFVKKLYSGGDSVKWGCGRRTADGGWRTADGGRQKIKNEKQ